MLIYAVDAVGNRTATPLTFDVWMDNVAPVLAVTDHLSVYGAGHVCDGHQRHRDRRQPDGQRRAANPGP